MDELTIAVLKQFAERDSLSLDQFAALANCSLESAVYPVAHLRNLGYLRIHPNQPHAHELNQQPGLDPLIPLQITYAGRALLASEKKSQRRYIFNELRAWITAVIAVLAFIKSFFI